MLKPHIASQHNIYQPAPDTREPLFLNCVVFSANQERVSELPIFLTLKWKFCSSRSFTSYEESNKCWFFLWRIRRIKLEFSNSKSIKIFIREENSFELKQEDQKNGIDQIYGQEDEESLVKGMKVASLQRNATSFKNKIMPLQFL